MINHKRQKGFSVVEFLLLLILVGILAGTGWYVWKANKNTNETLSEANKASSSQAASSKSASNTYAGWKTYKSPVEGFSIKYPADWTLRTGARISNQVYEPMLEAATIAGPNNFFLSYDIVKPVTPSTCINCTFTLLNTIRLKNNQPGYIVIQSNTVNGNLEEQNVTISKSKTYKEQSDQIWPYYNAFATPGEFVRWTGGYYPKFDNTKNECGDFGCAPDSISLADFRKKPEVKTAVQILQSLSY